MKTNIAYFRRRGWHHLVIQACFTLMTFNGSCGTNEAEHARYPNGLIKAAQAFKSASPTNRYTEAEKVWKELPKCPVTFEKDIRTGTLRSYDFSKPSYVLSSKEVLALLGEPVLVKTNADARIFSYLISEKRPGRSWTLSVQFRNDWVVLSNLQGPVNRKY